MLECQDCDKNNIPNGAGQCPRCAQNHLRNLTTNTVDLSAAQDGSLQVTSEHVTLARDWVVTPALHVVPNPGSGLMATTTPGAPVQWVEIGNGTAVNATVVGPNVVFADRVEHTDVQRVATPRVVSFHRPVFVDAILRHTFANRVTPPPPYASGQTQRGANIGDLAEFNNGHLIGVSLGGADEYRNIVPMVRWMNQSGAWSRLETALDAAFQAAQALNLQAAGALALQRVRVKIEIEYSRFGDPRVPVGFYVQARRNATRLSHYWLANDGDPPAAPTAAEIKTWLMAHYALNLVPFATLADRQNFFTANGGNNAQAADPLHDVWAFISALGVVSLAGGPALQAADPLPNPPYQALQWIDSVNNYWSYIVTDSYPPVPAPNPNFDFRADRTQALSAANAGPARPFPAMPIEQVVAFSDFTAFQRSMMRKYNHWRNGGQLVSDARAGLYAGEQVDLYLNLDQGGGRNFPEVDHVATKNNGGANSYDNARVVSFAHNHIYRDKPQFGALTLSHANYPTRWPNSIPPLADARLDGLRVTSGSVYYPVTELVKARRQYLAYQQRSAANYGTENGAAAGFLALRALHALGLQHFRAQQSLAERNRLRQAFGNLALVLR